MSNGLTVVKLGGSHAGGPRLRDIVAAIAGASRPCVVVPGGGPFADAVRAAQHAIGFDDGAAHRMALLAMCQFGEALASFHPRLVPANGLARTRELLAQDAVPVWMPWPVGDGLDEVPASWDITSDSLAAWLGTRLGAARLLLLKSTDPPPRPVHVEETAKWGVADPAFAHYLVGSGLEAWWLGPSALPGLAALIGGTGNAGVPIRTGPA